MQLWVCLNRTSDVCVLNIWYLFRYNEVMNFFLQMTHFLFKFMF